MEQMTNILFKTVKEEFVYPHRAPLLAYFGLVRKEIKDVLRFRWWEFGAAVGLGVTALVAYKKWPEKLNVKISAGASRIPESKRAGSEEMSMREPDSQVSIAWKEGGDLVKQACGVRMSNCLVTAMHAIPEDKELWLIKGNGDKQRKEKLEINELHVLAADAVAVPLPGNYWSKLGVAQCKLGALNNRASVTIVGVDIKGTVGALSAKPGVIGEVEYAATTCEGYSGAGYYEGSKLVGLHVHGGRFNGGYEALFLHAMTKVQNERTDEASEDFFLNQARKGKNYSASVQGDFVVMRDDTGHYHVTTTSIFDKYKDETEKRALMTQRAYEDMANDPDSWMNIADDDEWGGYESECKKTPGESKGGKNPPKIPSVSNTSEQSTQDRLTKRHKLIQRLSNVSNRDLEKWLKTHTQNMSQRKLPTPPPIRASTSKV